MFWSSCVALVGAAGCGTFAMDYRPANAEQRIGVDLLASEPTIWRQNGIGEVAAVEQGAALSQISRCALSPGGRVSTRAGR